MNYKITTIIFTIFFIVTGGLYINQLTENKDIELGISVSNY